MAESCDRKLSHERRMAKAKVNHLKSRGTTANTRSFPMQLMSCCCSLGAGFGMLLRGDQERRRRGNGHVPIMNSSPAPDTNMDNLFN